MADLTDSQRLYLSLLDEAAGPANILVYRPGPAIDALLADLYGYDDPGVDDDGQPIPVPAGEERILGTNPWFGSDYWFVQATETTPKREILARALERAVLGDSGPLDALLDGELERQRYIALAP